MSKLERTVKKDICKYLDSIPNLYWERREALGTSYKKGVPDIFAVYKGYHIEIETKREEGGKLSTMQEKFVSKCKKYGMIYILADKVEDVRNLINKIDLAR